MYKDVPISLPLCWQSNWKSSV